MKQFALLSIFDERDKNEYTLCIRHFGDKKGEAFFQNIASVYGAEIYSSASHYFLKLHLKVPLFGDLDIGPFSAMRNKVFSNLLANGWEPFAATSDTYGYWGVNNTQLVRNPGELFFRFQYD